MRKIQELNNKISGKTILVLAKHNSISQAVTINLELIYHCCVQQCTLNYETTRKLPDYLSDFNPDLILIAVPTEIFSAPSIFQDITWIKRFEDIPILVVCEAPGVNVTGCDNINYLLFPYEQDELHNKLVSIIKTDFSDESPGTSLHSVVYPWIITSGIVNDPEKLATLHYLS